jgi:hypothetical protein
MDTICGDAATEIAVSASGGEQSHMDGEFSPNNGTFSTTNGEYSPIDGEFSPTGREIFATDGEFSATSSENFAIGGVFPSTGSEFCDFCDSFCGVSCAANVACWRCDKAIESVCG